MVNKISVCKGIQIRLQSNMSLKKLEIRFIPLNRQFIQAVFRGLAKNKMLQKLVLTHNCL